MDRRRKNRTVNKSAKAANQIAATGRRAAGGKVRIANQVSPIKPFYSRPRSFRLAARRDPLPGPERGIMTALFFLPRKLLLDFLSLCRGEFQRSIGTRLWDFLGSSEELTDAARWIPGSEHVSKERVRICLCSSFAQGVFVIHPCVDDDLILAGKTVKQTIPLVKLRPKPMAVVFAESVSLAKFGCVRIFRDEFQDVPPDGSEEFRGGLILIVRRVSCGKSFNLSDKPFELLRE